MVSWRACLRGAGRDADGPRLHILTARIAWACTLSKKRDASGAELPLPLYDYTKGFNTQPEHFDFDLVARSPERHEAVKASLREARANRQA